MPRYLHDDCPGRGRDRASARRSASGDGRFSGDIVTTADAAAAGELLLVPVMRRERRVDNLPTLEESRGHAATQLAALPRTLAGLEADRYPVTIANVLRQLAACDRRMDDIAAATAAA